MSRIFLALLLAAAWLDAHAQSALPPCPDSKKAIWTNCFGAHTYSDGATAKYVGEWRDNKRHGRGTYTYADGSKYVGEFRDSKSHGQGTQTWSDGRKYVGDWKNDERNGQGIQYTANGTIELSGMWANGALSQAYAIDASRFPLNAVSAVATAADSGDEVFHLERDLAAAEERIKSLESELAQARKATKSPSVESGQSLVTKCLKKSLRPGTPEFSKCVASQGGVP